MLPAREASEENNTFSRRKLNAQRLQSAAFIFGLHTSIDACEYANIMITFCKGVRVGKFDV